MDNVNLNEGDAIDNVFGCLNEVRGHYASHHDVVQDYVGIKVKKVKGLCMRTIGKHTIHGVVHCMILSLRVERETIVCIVLSSK